MIFQDPLASLNPMMTVAGAIEDPLIIHNVGTPDVADQEIGAVYRRPVGR